MLEKEDKKEKKIEEKPEKTESLPGYTVRLRKDSENITLTFKHNRAFELHVGREMYRFEGQVTLSVPAWVQRHKDFTKDIKNLFVVKGV